MKEVTVELGLKGLLGSQQAELDAAEKDFKSWRQEETTYTWSTDTQNVFLGLAASASPGNLLEMQTLRAHPQTY